MTDIHQFACLLRPPTTRPHASVCRQLSRVVASCGTTPPLQPALTAGVGHRRQVGRGGRRLSKTWRCSSEHSISWLSGSLSVHVSSTVAPPHDVGRSPAFLRKLVITRTAGGTGRIRARTQIQKRAAKNAFNNALITHAHARGETARTHGANSNGERANYTRACAWLVYAQTEARIRTSICANALITHAHTRVARMGAHRGANSNERMRARARGASIRVPRAESGRPTQQSAYAWIGNWVGSVGSGRVA